MKTLIGFTFGTVIGLIAITLILPKQTVYQTEVFTRTVIDEKLTTLDLDELRNQIDQLDDELYIECVNVIERTSGDPRAGIIHHIDRHYQGDACRAADEALNGNW